MENLWQETAEINSNFESKEKRQKEMLDDLAEEMARVEHENS